MTREPLSAERWGALRALAEGEPPTHARLAACAGVHLTTVSNRAAQDGQEGLDFRRPAVRQAFRGVVQLAARARAGEPLDLPPDADAAGPERVGEALPALPELPAAERWTRMRAMMATQMETMLRHGEAGAPIEARQVAGLSALAQLLDRTAPPDAEKERRQLSQERTNETMRKLNERIETLALGLAVRILARHGLDYSHELEAIADEDTRAGLRRDGLLTDGAGADGTEPAEAKPGDITRP